MVSGGSPLGTWITVTDAVVGSHRHRSSLDGGARELADCMGSSYEHAIRARGRLRALRLLFLDEVAISDNRLDARHPSFHSLAAARCLFICRVHKSGARCSSVGLRV